MTIHYFGLTNVPKQKQKPEINEACHLILCAKVATFFFIPNGDTEKKKWLAAEAGFYYNFKSKVEKPAKAIL